MVCAADVIALVNACIPPAYAEAWDNCGLQVGDGRWPVHKIMVALDPTPAVVDEAVACGAGFLLTHHPLIFSPLKQVDGETAIGGIIATACRHQLTLFAAHTNLDSMAGGLNDLLAERIGLESLSVLIPDPGGDTHAGLGRIGSLAGAGMTLEQLATRLKDLLGASGVRFCGDPMSRVKRVALCTGSGSSLFKQVAVCGVDAYITGDLKYHEVRDMEAAGIGAVDIGHFPSEHIMVAAVVEKMTQAVKNAGLPLEVLASRCESDPFQWV
ncbi:MAG: Nif3-like dinuclear metal center hexameric protein [Deltaproteobacteria bacterium]|nr:MAG: Nif3-like dinuclear metal center hexameric protein [Deltaproteobacteria bacterium]